MDWIILCTFLAIAMAAILFLTHHSQSRVPTSLSRKRRTDLTKELLQHESFFARENQSIKWWVGLVPNDNFGLAKDLHEAFSDAGWIADHWRQRVDEKYANGVWVSGTHAELMIAVLSVAKIKAKKRDVQGDDIVIVCGE